MTQTNGPAGYHFFSNMTFVGLSDLLGVNWCLLCYCRRFTIISKDYTSVQASSDVSLYVSGAFIFKFPDCMSFVRIIDL